MYTAPLSIRDIPSEASPPPPAAQSPLSFITQTKAASTATTATTTPLVPEQQQLLPTSKKQVRFDTVTVREYPIILVDNPACRGGPPIGLGWEYSVQAEILPVGHYSIGPGADQRHLMPPIVSPHHPDLDDTSVASSTASSALLSPTISSPPEKSKSKSPLSQKLSPKNHHHSSRHRRSSSNVGPSVVHTSELGWEYTAGDGSSRGSTTGTRGYQPAVELSPKPTKRLSSYFANGPVSIADYEQLRPSADRRRAKGRSLGCMYLSQFTRQTRLVQDGTTDGAMAAIVAECRQIRVSRERSKHGICPWHPYARGSPGVRRRKVRRALRKLSVMDTGAVMGDTAHHHPPIENRDLYRGWWLPLSAYCW